MDHDEALTYPGYLKPVKEWDLMWVLANVWGWSNDRCVITTVALYNTSRDFGGFLAWLNYQPQRFARNFTIQPRINLFYGRDPWAGDFGLVRGCSEGLLTLKYEF